VTAPPTDISTVVLYRTIGSAELKLIEATGFKAFPPRLPDQPIFYPVTTQRMRSKSPATGTRSSTPNVVLSRAFKWLNLTSTGMNHS
jgi:hypothetical protein